MKFTKEQLTQIISEGINQGVARSQQSAHLTEKAKIKVGTQGDDVKLKGDPEQLKRRMDYLDGVPEFMAALPLFIEYMMEYDEEKATISHLRKGIQAAFEKAGASVGLANLMVTAIQRAAQEKKEFESVQATKLKNPPAEEE